MMVFLSLAVAGGLVSAGWLVSLSVFICGVLKKNTRLQDIGTGLMWSTAAVAFFAAAVVNFLR